MRGAAGSDVPVTADLDELGDGAPCCDLHRRQLGGRLPLHGDHRYSDDDGIVLVAPS